jgi:alpha/beta superfamily hydrolase
MVPPVDLPPPPERPELPPEVQMAGKEELFVLAEGARRQALALLPSAAGRVGWLRFNFRGVGKSEGQIVAAGRDPFSSPEETSELAGRLHATLSVVPEAEHDFIRFRREVARLVVPFVAPELSP